MPRIRDEGAGGGGGPAPGGHLVAAVAETRLEEPGAKRRQGLRPSRTPVRTATWAAPEPAPPRGHDPGAETLRGGGATPADRSTGSKASPPVVRERLVRLRHLLQVVLALDRRADSV